MKVPTNNYPINPANFYRVFRRLLQIFVAIMLIFILVSGYLFVQGLESRKWPSVEGRVVYSRLTRRGKHLNAEIEYTYEVDGQKFSNDKITVESLIHLNTRSAKKLARMYRSGQTVPVYYDPKKHSRSVLKPGPGIEITVILAVSIFLYIFGLLALKALPKQEDQPYVMPGQQIEPESTGVQILDQGKDEKLKTPLKVSRAVNVMGVIIFIVVSAFTFWPLVKPILINRHHYKKIVHSGKPGSVTSHSRSSGKIANKAKSNSDAWMQARNLKNQGFKLLKKKKYSQATEVFKRCLATLDTIGGRKLSVYPRVLNYIGYSLYKDGRLDEAEKAYQKAISIAEGMGTAESVSVAAACDGLGRVYAKGGKLEQAEKAFKRSIKMWRLVKGGENGNSVAGMYRCAAVLDKLGKHKEAVEMREQAKRELEIIKERKRKIKNG